VNTTVSTASCPVCHGTCTALDAVDFSKSCMEIHGRFLPPSGVPVHYFLCAECGYCHAPEFRDWPAAAFAAKIYNAGYAEVDPDYAETRPRANADNLLAMFGERGTGIRHLDFGGGSGVLSGLLRTAGWQSVCHDPFVPQNVRIAGDARFNLITAFEVFEHVPRPDQLMTELRALLDPDGVVLFSTLLSDGQLAPGRPPAWWYAAPRNGHVSLFSSKSLERLAAGAGFSFGSFSGGFHAFWAGVPAWARHLIPPPSTRTD
jgi:SAM-dependent methyltransferase